MLIYTLKKNIKLLRDIVTVPTATLIESTPAYPKPTKYPILQLSHPIVPHCGLNFSSRNLSHLLSFPILQPPPPPPSFPPLHTPTLAGDLV